MASRRRNAANDTRARSRARVDGAPAEVVRREPFAVNPHVGARGQRTQQRILEAALAVFGEQGYDCCSIDPIAQRAGCSRAAFYQYFSGKEDVFRHLTGQVARQLDAATESLGPLLPSEAGWLALRTWIARHGEIHHRYEPVFHVFQAASQSDHAVATGSARWAERAVSRIGARVTATVLRPRDLDPVILQLLGCVTRTLDVARILRSAAPEAYVEARIGDALADVIHRSLYGRLDGVNVHSAPRRRAPVLRFDPAVRDAFTEGEPPGKLTPAGRSTWEALADAGRKAFVERGYHRTRVGDVVLMAGLSRGAFYRYFADTDQLARVLGARAMQSVARVLAEIPDAAAIDGAAGRATLRRWLRRYDLAQADEAAMLRVWVDAALQDATLRANSAAALDWGRRAMVAFLEPRGFGDADVESVVMLALLSSFGEKERTAAEVDAAAQVIERGLLGLARA